MTYYVYMLTNRSRVVLYIGVTHSLQGRMWHHANTAKNSFVKKYKLDRLVCYEVYHDIRDAIAREKQLKHWSRGKKNDLVRRFESEMGGSVYENVRREHAGSLDFARDDKLRAL